MSESTSDHVKQSNALHDFIVNASPTKEKAEPEGVVRERERQEALRQKDETVRTWRAYISGQEPVEGKVDGKQLGQLVVALGGVGIVSEMLGIRPFDVEQAVKYSDTTPLSDKAIRKFVTAAKAAIARGAQ